MLRISCIEIYNEKVRDLLSDSVADLPIKEFKEKTIVDGLREEVIVCKDGVAMLIQRAFGTVFFYFSKQLDPKKKLELQVTVWLVQSR